MELLFESRINLSEFAGHLRFVQGKARVHPEPVLLPDSPADGKGLSIYGSVHRDGGKLRMWYQAMPEDWDYKNDMASVAYAESDDGIHWTKPALGQVEHGSGPSNLLSLALHCPSVFIDPNSPPSHRYRATGCAYPGLFMAPPQITEPGYYTAHSADGLGWEFDRHTPQWRSGDVITSIHHPGQDRGIVAMKYSPRTGRLMRRSIHTAELVDGTYSGHVSALYPDETDDAIAAVRGYHSCDYYGMGMQGAGSGTVGFLWNFWHGLPYTTSQHFALFGTSDVTLVYQPDRGGRWLHVPGRPIFIDHTDQPWMTGWINTSSCPVEVGGEHRLYFSGTRASHGFYLDSSWKPLDNWTEWTTRHGKGCIGYASWPKWRLFGLSADPEGWVDIDLGEVAQPSELWLNYNAGPGGRIRAQVHDDSARTFDDCTPLSTDNTGERVTWKSGGALQSAPGQSLKIRLHLEYSTAWAYSVKRCA